MSILGNKYEIIDEEEQKGYTLPAVIKKDEKELTFEQSVAISTAAHPLTVALVALLITILGWVGIDLFKTPVMPDKKDIEFVLVDKPDQPKDPNTKNRADMSSRTGGVQVDKKKPLSLPSASKPKQSSASSSLQKMIEKQQKALQQEQAQQKTVQKKVAPQKTEAHHSESPRQVTKPSPKPPATRPSLAPSNRPVSAPKTVAPKQTTPFAVPVPSGAPRGNYLATGPVGGTGTAGSARSGGYASGRGGTGTKKYAPTPSLSTYSGSGTGSARGTGGSKGTGGYSGAGNPGGGGGRPGIDAIKEPDFGPYMRELQRRIKTNWNPPKGNESRKVVLLFKIAKNGQLLSCRVFRSSGLPSADQAALNAVKMTAPFKPLPADYKGTNIDIQFTFDYNVFGASMR